MAAERAKLVGSFPVSVLFTAIVQIVKQFVFYEWLFFLQMIYETVVIQVHTDEQHHPHHTSHLGMWASWMIASKIPTKLWDFSSLSKDWKTVVAHKTSNLLYNAGDKNYNKKQNIIAASTTGTGCKPICFGPLHICDRAPEAQMHKFFVTISLSPCREPKTVPRSYYEKINEDENAQGQTGGASLLLQDSVTRSGESLQEDTPEWQYYHTLQQTDCWYWN